MHITVRPVTDQKTSKSVSVECMPHRWAEQGEELYIQAPFVINGRIEFINALTINPTTL